LFLAGTGSFAAEVADWAADAGWSVAGLIELVDRARVGSLVAGLPVVDTSPPHERESVVIAMGG